MDDNDIMRMKLERYLHRVEQKIVYKKKLLVELHKFSNLTESTIVKLVRDAEKDLKDAEKNIVDQQQHDGNTV